MEYQWLDVHLVLNFNMHPTLRSSALEMPSQFVSFVKSREESLVNSKSLFKLPDSSPPQFNAVRR